MDQRSITGLLRSLLYQLLSDCPHLAQHINTDEDRRQWTFKRLKSALDTLVAQCEHEKINICLVLDGLDEFQGDVTEQSLLVDLILRLTQNPRIKAIVSSRPEPLFVDRLSSHGGIRLQDLTAPDMFRFVQGKLLDEPMILRYKVSKSQLVATALPVKLPRIQVEGLGRSLRRTSHG